MVQATTEQLDPITLEVISGSFVAICNEMGTAMIKTAYSPIFSEGRDFSIAMFDPSCEMVAQGVGCPAQLGALQLWLRFREEPARALEDYLAALALGGSRPLPELFETAGIRFDFSPQTLRPIMQAVGEELERLG